MASFLRSVNSLKAGTMILCYRRRVPLASSLLCETHVTAWMWVPCGRQLGRWNPIQITGIRVWFAPQLECTTRKWGRFGSSLESQTSSHPERCGTCPLIWPFAPDGVEVQQQCGVWESLGDLNPPILTLNTERQQVGNGFYFQSLVWPSRGLEPTTYQCDCTQASTGALSWWPLITKPFKQRAV